MFVLGTLAKYYSLVAFFSLLVSWCKRESLMHSINGLFFSFFRSTSFRFVNAARQVISVCFCISVLRVHIAQEHRFARMILSSSLTPITQDLQMSTYSLKSRKISYLKDFKFPSMGKWCPETTVVTTRRLEPARNRCVCNWTYCLAICCINSVLNQVVAKF